MTAQEVLSYLSRQGIELWIEGDKLRYRGVKRTLPPPLIALLRQHKTELQQLLRERKKNPAAPFPLSYMQKAFWFLYQMNPASSAYVGSLAVSLHGPVDVKALQQAFEQLCQRHPILRTRIIIHDGGPWQEVDARSTCLLEVIDAAAWTPDALREHLQAEAHRPFDLLQDPLVRLHLYQRSAEQCVLFLCMHHIHTDGWSLGLLLRDFGALYRSALSGQPAQLPASPASFSDFVSAQQQLALSPEGEMQLTYWMDELTRLPPALDLPTDYPRPKVRSERGERIPWVVAPTLTQHLRQLALREGTTLNVLLLSLFATLLHRYSDQAEFMIGSPYHGRSESRWENALGCFINSVALRASFSPGLTFRALLQEMQRKVHTALAHADYPFPLLVERLRPNRDLSRTPLFQTMFAYDNFPFASLLQPLAAGASLPAEANELFGLPLTPFPLSQQEGQFDLTMTVTDSTEVLSYSLSYSTDLFEPRTIEQMALHFEQLARSVVEDPEQRVAMLPLLSAAKRHQLLHEWNPPPRGIRIEDTFPNHFCAQVERTPDAPAVNYQEQTLSYRELSATAAQLAHRLRDRGVGPELLVGLCVDRSLMMMVGVVGIWLAGGAYVPLDPTLPPDRLEHMLRDSAVSVIVTHRHYAERLKHPQRQLLFVEDEALRQLPTTPPAVELTAHNLAYCIYTSGSTGCPRGVLVEHGSMLHLAQALRTTLRPEPSRPLRVSLNASLVFDSSVKLLLLLLSGDCLDVTPEAVRMDASALVSHARARRLDLIDCTPTMLAELLAGGLLAAPENAPAWLWIGGEAIPESMWRTLRAARNTRAINLYGPTECTVDTTLCEIGLGPERPVIGKPFGHVRTYVLDAAGNLAPVGVPGEIYVSGPGVARGYLNQPRLTEEKFLPDPFAPGERMYRTGDRARWLPDGTIEYLGRLDLQVKLRGYRIELGEIESILRTQPGVHDCAVVMREDRPGDKRLVGYLVKSPEQSPNLAELRAALREQLPEYMIPASLVIVPAFPRTATGKLDRRALPAPDLAQQPAEQIRIIESPRDTLELTLVSLWEEILGLPAVSIHDNFFDLGGHSLLAMRLLGRLAGPGGRLIPLSALFQHQTIAELARYLRQRSEFRTPETVVPLCGRPYHDSRPPLFCVHPVGGNVLCYVPLTRALGPKQPTYGIQSLPMPSPAAAETLESAAAYYVAQLQKTQPCGPYQLLGWSFGGVMAFEMARQLRQAGQEVARLVLVDSYEPSYVRTNAAQPELPSQTQTLAWFVCDLLQLPKGDADVRHLLGEDPQLGTILGQLRDRGRHPADMNPAQLNALYEMFRRNLRLLHSYQAGPYADPVVLINAQESQGAAADHGWGRVCQGQLEILTVPGTHYSILAQPSAALVAAEVLPRLVASGEP